MQTAPVDEHAVPADAAHAGSAHVVPFGVLLGVFVALLALTYLTVAARYVDLGSLNIWIALGIATIKGALVVLYFMHLRYDSPFNSIVFLTALAFMLLFLGITILDTIQYAPDIEEMRLMQSP
ncbi:MAG: cytochrome C oxidase subunit IV family protein [Pirellulaceae bacterium]|jgi:cytochrome c oxidase subunit 4|nr:cytochrome C oxidase subunit IV family protein [Pirellulaceae bacterium]